MLSSTSLSPGSAQSLALGAAPFLPSPAKDLQSCYVFEPQHHCFSPLHPSTCTSPPFGPSSNLPLHYGQLDPLSSPAMQGSAGLLGSASAAAGTPPSAGGSHSLIHGDLHSFSPPDLNIGGPFFSLSNTASNGMGNEVLVPEERSSLACQHFSTPFHGTSVSSASFDTPASAPAPVARSSWQLVQVKHTGPAAAELFHHQEAASYDFSPQLAGQGSSTLQNRESAVAHPPAGTSYVSPMPAPLTLSFPVPEQVAQVGTPCTSTAAAGTLPRTYFSPSNSVPYESRFMAPKLESSAQLPGRKRVRESGITTTNEDGYSWLKYGEKRLSSVRRTRAYFRCSKSKENDCPAKKFVDVLEDDHDGNNAMITYVQSHNHPQDPVVFAGIGPPFGHSPRVFYKGQGPGYGSASVQGTGKESRPAGRPQAFQPQEKAHPLVSG